MRVLLDTHFLLWWLDDSAELGDKAREVISRPENLVFYSAASLWELRSKESTGKIDLPENFLAILQNEPFEALAVTVRHADALRGLPMHHRDPFDRMLIAQAVTEKLTLLTRDEFIPLYDVASISA